MIRKQTTRRGFLAGTAATLAAPAILSSTRAYAQTPTLRVGHVSPQTGPLAAFAEADDHILAGIQEAFAGGLENNGRAWNIEIISKDSQSNSNRASEVAADLILGDEVDIIVVASTPDTVNPVADQAEINEVPCISTDCPWQPYFFGRNGVPGEGFQSTYHFFFGIEDWIGATLGMWAGVDVGTQVAGMFPNDADGNAFGDPDLGLPPAMTAAGYTITDPGRYQPLTDDFSNQIAAFKEVGCTIVTGNMIPPDFATFWGQAAQQGFNPQIVTIGKALLFPSVIESLGDRGDGLTTEVWWSPDHPYSSSLTGISARDLTAGYTSATGRPWTQPIGFKHALFEVVADVIKRAEDLEDPASIVSAIASTNLDTMVGNVNWDNGPINNVTKTPLVAGQWQKEGDGFDLKIVGNAGQPDIALTGELKLLS
jgi:branched-chain amino acid transport system substrate-binding protein